MRRSAMVGVAACLAILALSARGSAAESTSLKDVLSGVAHPTTLRLNELAGDWKCVNTNGQSEASGYLQLVAGMAGGASLMGAHGTFYTKGDTVTVGQETYLIAYRQASKPISMYMMQHEEPKPELLKPDSALSLSLLNLRTAGSLTDIRSFNIDEELTANKKMFSDVFGDEYAESEVAPGTRTKSLNNLKQMAVAMCMYMSDWDDRMPPMKTSEEAKTALSPYIKKNDIFVQPETGKPYAVNPILSGRKEGHISNTSEMVVFYEAEPDADGTRCVAFMDGHCVQIHEEEWAITKRRSRIP